MAEQTPPGGESLGPTPLDEYERAVAAYTAAGGHETVQRLMTAMSRLNRRLDVAYRQQFARLALSTGEWSVLSALAVGGAAGCTPSHLADVGGVSPSTMTHRLDGMAARGLIAKDVDAENRTRMRVVLTAAGRELFRQAVLAAETVEVRVLEPLSDTRQRQLADLLEQVVAGLGRSS